MAKYTYTRICGLVIRVCPGEPMECYVRGKWVPYPL